MKNVILSVFSVLGMLLISNISVAQNKELQGILTGENGQKEEMNNLKFQEYFFEALKDYATNNYKKAIENLEVCYQIDSVNMAVEFEFSKNYYLLKEYYLAELFVEKALKRELNNSHLLKHKILVLKAQQKYKDAIETQKQLITIKPSASEGLVLLYIQNKEFNKAEDLISEIEEKALGTLRLKRFKLYIENRKKTSEKVANSTSKLTENSSIDVLTKKFNETKDYKILLEILSYDVKNSLFDKLYTHSKEGLELYPAQPILYQLNGFALNRLKKYNEAIDVLTTGIDFVIDNNKMELSYYNELIISYQGINNKQLALKYKLKADKLKEAN